MRILFIIPELSTGGSERQLLVLARELKALGHEVRIVALRPPRRPFPFEHDIEVLTLGGRAPHDPLFLVDCAREIRAFQPDVLHTFLFGFDLWANLAARFAGVPCVISSRREIATWQMRRHLVFQNAANRLVDAVIANSEAAADFAFRHESNLNRGQVHSIPNALAPGRVAPDELPLPPKTGPVFTMIANFWPGKNQEMLIRASAAIAPDAGSALWLVGDGPRLERARAQASDLGIASRIHFLGRRHNIAAILAQTDFYIHASSMESSPNAILEAMDAGVPVLASACGGVPELLDGGTSGLLFAPDDKAAMCDAIRFALANRERMSAMTLTAFRVVAERHTPRAMALRHEKLYGRIVAAGRGVAERPARLGVYLIGDRDLPSAWFRIFQMVPALQEAGIDLRVFELPATNGGRLRQMLGLIRQGVTRARQLRRSGRFDVVLVQKGLSPARWRGLVSRLKRAGVPVLYDVDDAVLDATPVVLPAPLRYLQDFDEPRRLVGLASGVIAGNPTLAARAKRQGTVIPSSVDSRRFWFSPLPPSREVPVVGWSGSASTNEYLNAVLPVLVRLAARHKFRLVVVSNSPRGLDAAQFGALDHGFIAWSREREVELLRGFDIGLMPLPDAPWERGKCGMKALLYMAAGVPPVCSPVGVNTEIVRDGVNGFLAANDEEWFSKLDRLLADPELRRRMGAAARESVLENYSVKKQSSRLVQFLHQAGLRCLP